VANPNQAGLYGQSKMSRLHLLNALLCHVSGSLQQLREAYSLNDIDLRHLGEAASIVAYVPECDVDTFLRSPAGGSRLQVPQWLYAMPCCLHEPDSPYIEYLVTVECGVDRVGVNSEGWLSLASLVLSKEGGNEGFAHAALALQDHVNLSHYSNSSLLGTGS
jgi:hypothetical protein